MPPEAAHVEAVFAEALRQTDPSKRADVANRLCGEDVELRERVQALLAAHEAAGSFLPLPDESGAGESLGRTQSTGQSAAGSGEAGAAGLDRTLGDDHPDTLKAHAFLADAFRDLGRHEEALSLWEQTFKKRKALLGADHLDTLLSIKCLADTYLAAGKPDKALPLAEQMLERARAALGADHHHTLLSMGTLVTRSTPITRIAWPARLVSGFSNVPGGDPLYKGEHIS